MERPITIRWVSLSRDLSKAPLSEKQARIDPASRPILACRGDKRLEQDLAREGAEVIPGNGNAPGTVNRETASMPRSYPDRPYVGVGIVVFRDDEVLLVERAKPPIQKIPQDEERMDGE